MEIKRAGAHVVDQGPAEYFTGTVRIERLVHSPPPPLGQTFLVTAGCGWAQRWGGEVEEIRPGDVVWFAPGEKHWHGATPTTAMTHIAISEKLNGKAVNWMEHVTDERYRRE